MNLVKYANDCFSETYCYIEVVFLGSAKFRWNRERERRGLNHVLIWFAEVTCLSDIPALTAPEPEFPVIFGSK